MAEAGVIAASGPASASSVAGVMAGAQVAAAAAMALAVNLYMQRAGSIARYGNPWGMPREDIGFAVLRVARELRSQPYPVPRELPVPRTEEERRSRPRLLGRIYATYTKKNKQTGLVYSGRTSAVIDLNQPWRPQAEAAVRVRDANHHIDENDEPTDPAFERADLDQYAVGFAVDYSERYRDVAYAAIRGREQQLIDHHGQQEHARLGSTSAFRGGARTDSQPGPRLTENDVRGVGRNEQLGLAFWWASNVAFQPLAPFTGNIVNQQTGATAGAR